MLSSCFTQPVTLCSALANAVSFLIHPPAEPNEQEKQKSKVFLSLDPVLLVLEGQQPSREIVSDLTKMLKGTGKWPQGGDRFSRLRKESQVPFTDVLACLLLWIGEDYFRVMHELVGILKWWPQRRGGL